MATYPIDGTVCDAQGRPLAGVAVSFSSAPVSLPEIAMLTDVGGAFRTSVPAAGSYGLTFNLNGFERMTVHVEVPVPTPPPMRIVMRRA